LTRGFGGSGLITAVQDGQLDVIGSGSAVFVCSRGDVGGTAPCHEFVHKPITQGVDIGFGEAEAASGIGVTADRHQKSQWNPRSFARCRGILVEYRELSDCQNAVGPEAFASHRRVCRRHESRDRAGESVAGDVEFAWAYRGQDSAPLGYRVFGSVELIEVLGECGKGAGPLRSAQADQ
jgi:hypothetical protein